MTGTIYFKFSLRGMYHAIYYDISDLLSAQIIKANRPINDQLTFMSVMSV